MSWETPLSRLAIISFILSIFFVQQRVPIPDRTLLQCSTLQLLLGNKVSFPGQSTYNASLQSYWSQQVQQVSPACIARPESSKDVATAVRALTTVAYTTSLFGGRQCRFAIRGGGHTPWAGSANIDKGVTLDLNAMRDVSVNSEKTVTSIGGGARWIDVYSKLDAMSLSVSGGRVADTGVAGLILGGGLSFFSPLHGFACSNVQNLEVVLASGVIANANATHNPDLFFALKGGSNNFGIVTRVDLLTFPQGHLWGGLIYYPISTLPAQINAFVTFSSGASREYDPYASAITSFGYSSERKSWGVSNYIMYTKPKAYPAALAPFTDIKPQLFSTLRISNLSDFTIEQSGYSPRGQRYLFSTLTIHTCPSFLTHISSLFASSLHPLLPVLGLSYTLTFQALPSPLPFPTSPNSTSPSTLTLLLISASWTSPSSDTLIANASRAFFSTVSAEAKERGLGHEWVYLNYAAEGQDVWGGYGEEVRGRLRAVSRRYDFWGGFQREVVGGYKLW